MSTVIIRHDDWRQISEMQLRHRADWPAVFSTNCHSHVWLFVTRGYTRPEDRIEVRGACQVIDQIADEYIRIRPEGGRFFIDHRGAFQMSDIGEIQFVEFEFPDGMPFELIQRMIRGLSPEDREALRELLQGDLKR